MTYRLKIISSGSMSILCCRVTGTVQVLLWGQQAGIAWGAVFLGRTAFVCPPLFLFFCFVWGYMIGAVIGLGPQASCVSSWLCNETFRKTLEPLVLCFVQRPVRSKPDSKLITDQK